MLTIARHDKWILVLVCFSCLPFQPPTAAYATDALLCNDKQIVAKINLKYVPAAAGPIKLVNISETSYGAPPANAADYLEKTRYCEAKIVMKNGASDMAYYRLSILKGGKIQNWVEPCFKSVNDKFGRNNCANDRTPLNGQKR